MTEKLGFTFINYRVCNYCSHLMRGMHRDGYNDGCGLRQTDGKYATIGGGESAVSVDGWKGCDQFSPSGVPAHPQVLEQLVRENPKCSQIPSDSNAIETSWDFEDKVRKYLPVINYISYTKIH